ncbi:hypothetical protein V2J09_005624 [Rumex salicifolius]
MLELFESLGIDMEDSDMSFSVSLDNGKGYEWGSRNGLSSLFAQKKNLFDPYFWKMIREITTFKDDVLSYLDELENNPEMDRNETLGNFIKSRGYSELFQTTYLIPMCASIWSCPSQQVMGFSAFSILSFCRNHHLLQVMEKLVDRGCQIKTNCEVDAISTGDEGCTISLKDGSHDLYDGCIIASHAPDALKILGDKATHDERRILGAFQYVYSDIFLHHDQTLMPQNQAAWSAWNFLGSSESKVTLTYWLNVLQNIDGGDKPFLVTLNPSNVPKSVLLKWSTGHPTPSVAASKASLEMNQIQGKRGIWFCGAYQGYGFHEDGLKGGLVAAHGLLGRKCNILQNPKQMVPSWRESASCILTSRFLRGFITTGCLNIFEDGGRILTFQGSSKKFAPKVAIRVHNPQFYVKVCMEADLGLADAYINGDFSFVDKNEGLLNLFMVFIANRDLKSSAAGPTSKRGWWTPMLFTSGIASAKYFYNHFSRRNTLTQARRNISRHYDLSNDMFSLFLDETMTYSCALFKSMNEDLRDAQLRKIHLLIEKAKIEKSHEILEIGCGWGSLAIEAVRLTGCKYTGITLSKEQLRFAEERVKEAGFQDRINEMLEAVGHEYMEDFFHCCDSVLADNGLLVLQFISIPDERYDEYRQSSDFIKEYIFPGGCLPSLSRVTSAMAAASKLCVEDIENIGIHYYQTLRKILSLGFDEKFIRTWEYYFDYCASGFKSRTLGNYQLGMEFE